MLGCHFRLTARHGACASTWSDRHRSSLVLLLGFRGADASREPAEVSVKSLTIEPNELGSSDFASPCQMSACGQNPARPSNKFGARCSLLRQAHQIQKRLRSGPFVPLRQALRYPPYSFNWPKLARCKEPGLSSSTGSFSGWPISEFGHGRRYWPRQPRVGGHLTASASPRRRGEPFSRF